MQYIIFFFNLVNMLQNVQNLISVLANSHQCPHKCRNITLKSMNGITSSFVIYAYSYPYSPWFMLSLSLCKHVPSYINDAWAMTDKPVSQPIMIHPYLWSVGEIAWWLIIIGITVCYLFIICIMFLWCMCLWYFSNTYHVAYTIIIIP